MVWTFLCSKIALLPIPENNRMCTSEVFFFHKLLFGDIKLSDLERRNRKLSAHDCTDHIKTLFFFPITTTKHVASWRPAMKFWSPGLNFQSHWRPGRRNFGPCYGGLLSTTALHVPLYLLAALAFSCIFCGCCCDNNILRMLKCKTF